MLDRAKEVKKLFKFLLTKQISEKWVMNYIVHKSGNENDYTKMLFEAQ